MIQHGTIRELIEAAVAESFDEHLRALHDDVVNRVMQSIGPSLETTPAQCSAKDLNAAVLTVQSASQQVEILKNMLESAAGFSARAALFILRGNVAVGWQARGFRDNDSIKAIMIDAGTGAVSSVIHRFAITSPLVSEFDPKFESSTGAPLDGRCVLAPLIVRGKVAALLYADAGDEGAPVDVHALELLVRAAGDWIELQALRKAAGAPTHYPVPSSTQSAPAPAVAVTAATVAVAAAASQVAGPSPAAVQPSPQAQQVPAALTAQPASVPDLPSIVPPAVVSGAATAPAESVADEEELHKKARRFAKLLVDEIVLYNQRKVAEGRQNHDLYDRLKDDIEKSRATYEKRYAQTSVTKRDYFTQALIAGLADHNVILLGGNFPR
jgi:hypothetical protein